MLAVGNARGLVIHQVDITSVYPNSKLHTTIYIQIPKGFDIYKLQDFKDVPEEDIALQVIQSLYRLKQSGREWYIEAYTGLKDLGFDPYYHNLSVFTNPTCLILIGLYIDDMLILGEDPLEVEKVIQGISSK